VAPNAVIRKIMTFFSLPFLQFHLRQLFRREPFFFIATAIASAVFLIALLAYFSQYAAQTEVDHEALSIKSHLPRSVSTTAQKAVPIPVFPAFDSTELVKALNTIASDAKMPIDEIVFSLDDNANRPYLRYHATLTLSANYAAIRKFINVLNLRLNDVSLDSITCTREDINAAGLNCDLSFSAFYRKEDHG
jgi:hypothetical protein